jgi:hypothetical protein
MEGPELPKHLGNLLIASLSEQPGSRALKCHSELGTWALLVCGRTGVVVNQDGARVLEQVGMNLGMEVNRSLEVGWVLLASKLFPSWVTAPALAAKGLVSMEKVSISRARSSMVGEPSVHRGRIDVEHES